MKAAPEIVEENFKGLDELIEDKELIYFYKSLIATCMNGFAEQFIDLAAEKAETQMFYKNRNKRWQKIVGEYEFDPLDFEHKTEVSKQSILKLKELIK